MTEPHCHTPRWPHPWELPVSLQVLLCPHQIPEKRSPRGYSPGSQTTGTATGTSHTPALPWMRSGEAGALRRQQVTHPLSFSEWRLGIKKQSKGGKRQASSLSTRPPSPALPTTRPSQIPTAPNLHTPIRPRVANAPQCQVGTRLEMQDGNHHKQGHVFVHTHASAVHPQMCTHARTHTCTSTHLHMHAQSSTCTHTQPHVCTHAHPPTCLCASTRMHTHVETSMHNYIILSSHFFRGKAKPIKTKF